MSCSFLEGTSKRKIDSSGTGFVDALFRGLLSVYVDTFKSLANIRFTSFGLHASLKPEHGAAGSDAEATVLLETSANSDDSTVMAFRKTGKSINVAAAKVVFEAIQFYINCELVYKKLKFLVLDAKSRDRNDVAAAYTSQLVDIVNIALCGNCE